MAQLTIPMEFDYDDLQRLVAEVKAQEPKTGHWIMTGAYGTIDYVECSCCHEYGLEEGNYCPNCGAKMIEPQESEDKK